MIEVFLRIAISLFLTILGILGFVVLFRLLLIPFLGPVWGIVVGTVIGVPVFVGLLMLLSEFYLA